MDVQPSSISVAGGFVVDKGAHLLHSIVMEGEDLRRLRHARGMTQVDLGQALGVSARTVKAWEKASVPAYKREAVRGFFGLDEAPEQSLPASLQEVTALLEAHGAVDCLRALALAMARSGHGE